MTEKARKSDRHAAEHDRHPSGEVHPEPAAPAPQARHAAAHGSKALPYRKEADYRRLLEHFQNAEWEKCLPHIDRLLKAHPGDEHLLAFKQDVRSRAAHEQHSETKREADDKRDRRRTRTRALVAVLAGIAIVGLIAWFVMAYQAEQTRQRLAAEATQTAEALAAQWEAAETFMRAGRPEQALELYTQIQSIDPEYGGIAQAVEAAQQAITIEDLYQQGTQALEAGDPEQALELLQNVDELKPEYKDTSRLIADIEREQKIASLVTSIHEAYRSGDSAAVIQYYEEILATDPLIELPDLDDELFTSYQSLVLGIASKRDPTLEEIQAAARYYRSAVALFPQSIAYAQERAELEEIAVELLASQYYLQGISLLESADYSMAGLQQSKLVLERAREKAPETPAADSAIEKSALFIDSYEKIVSGDWDDAILGFDTLYQRDPNFADGRVRYFLYEAYATRGDLLMLNGDFSGAFKDYQAAEKFAWADEENVMRIFQVEVRVAAALNRLHNYEQAAEFYRFAVEQAVIQARLKLPENAELLELLEKARTAHADGNEVAAISFYEELVRKSGMLYVLTETTARRGDTLPNIAFETGSTLASLRAANELGDSLIINRTQALVVPTLPGLQK